MARRKPIPVCLLTGYLGSGKTTLMNNILNQQEGYHVAVIVNDVGEVNIDARLIAEGASIQKEDSGSVVSLSNGCACCTLKADLIEQLKQLCDAGKYDYILIKASGAGNPITLAQTITMMDQALGLDEDEEPLCYLDNIVTVADAFRLTDEFNHGEDLQKETDEEDVERLIIEQLEFCNTILLHKVDLVSAEDLAQVKDVIKALAPDIKVIAPWRDDRWQMDSRQAEIDYCKAHGIDLPFGTDQSYSRDRNLWHISHEGLELEDPSKAPNYDHMLVLGVTPEKAPDESVDITLDFEKGVPVSLNGKKMKVADIIRELNTLGGKHGIGIVDIVENRVVGMKSRGVYETPGGTILMEAHDQLEELVLDRDTISLKKDLGNRLAQIVYEGKWFTPVREAISAFVTSTQEYVTGEVKLRLYKGNIIKAGTTSPYSLYSESLASFTTGDMYDHHDAEGFITLWGLPLKVRAMRMNELKKENTK